MYSRSAPQHDRGWDKRIPLTYGDGYKGSKLTKEYDEFCSMVEKNRREASHRNYDTLVEKSAKCVAQNLSRISPDDVACLPDHVLDVVAEKIMANPKVLTTVKDNAWDVYPIRMLQAIWDGLHKSDQLNLHLWKALSARLRGANINWVNDPRLYRFEKTLGIESKEPPAWDLTNYTKPLTSHTFDFIASLSIGYLFSMMDYIRLSDLVNLGTLEISDATGAKVDIEGSVPVVDFDRLFRAWALRAEQGMAFQVLRSFKLGISEYSLTVDILPHLNKFPVLSTVCPGSITRKAHTKNMAKYVSDHHLNSIEPLLPHGWVAVTSYGATAGRRRDHSITYPPTLVADRKLCVVENGERVFKLESEVPVVSLTVGELSTCKLWDETILIREGLPTEEIKETAKEGERQGKENFIAQRKRKSGSQANAKRKGKTFDMSFWEMTGMTPPKPTEEN